MKAPIRNAPRGGKARRGTLMLFLATAIVAGAAAMPVQADPAARDVSRVMEFGTGTVIPGAWSALLRNDNGVAMTLHATGLAPGSATTVWWVVFNNPELCSHGELGLRCGEGDLPPFGGDPAVQASVLWATGHVIGRKGIGNFGAYLGEGDTKGALFGPGLLDSRKADVHLIVRTHGPALPGLIPEQIGTFNGGCLPGEPNVGLCMNVQASPHEVG